MTAASALAGTETFEAVQSSASVKATAAQIRTYVTGGVVANTSTVIAEYIFDEDNEIDLSGSFADAQASATTTLTGLPSATTAIWAYIGLADTSTQPQIRWRRTAGGTQEYQIKGLWADAGTNEFYGTWWMPTGPGTIRTTSVIADVGITFKIIGYKTGA